MQGEAFQERSYWQGAVTEFEAALQLFPDNNNTKQLLVEGSLPNWDYRKDKIIFNDTNGFICVIDHNGSNITQIVRNSTNSIPAVPKWGPDGTKAVFMGRDITQMGSNNIIYVVLNFVILKEF